jgi:hypothetical protein
MDLVDCGEDVLDVVEDCFIERLKEKVADVPGWGGCLQIPNYVGRFKICMFKNFFSRFSMYDIDIFLKFWLLVSEIWSKNNVV